MILNVPMTIFQVCPNGSFWIEPVLHVSNDYCVLLKDTAQWRRWRSNTQQLGLESSTLPLSHCAPQWWIKIRLKFILYHELAISEIFTRESKDSVTIHKKVALNKAIMIVAIYNFTQKPE